MFRNLFRPDSPLMVTMTQITDCIFLSLFWLICSFPVITIGAATAAMYDAVYHTFRKGQKGCWQRYWRSFGTNLKSSIPVTVVFLTIVVLLGWGMIQLWNNAVYGNISWMVFSGIAFVAFALSGVLSLLLPMLSRFENSALNLWWNTLQLGFANLPMTMGLAAINCVCIFFCIRYLFPLFFLPGLASLLSTLLIEPLFKPFMPQDSIEE
ncbi:MAG: YesL family protein [Oscillospiraceae bacterium]|nr:YesL family protein [Oscillospiraceae bacterium]